MDSCMQVLPEAAIGTQKLYNQERYTKWVYKAIQCLEQ